VDVEPGDVVNVPQGASKGKSFIDGLTRFSPILSIATSAISIAYAVRR
jgi:hypothetical protein